ncbi:tyrosine-type recombinase/integrase [Scytonema sp. UIC 10036]|uniref:tyrosine-type recombinase/integrase n=1 Tax=Scytonema sp. UIC 10036 TaxID=2304196 RepID=UPI001A9AC332|nr:tyrosine-type recombinase/integrase [Scytonema sp. UIC 10036]
MKKDCLVQEGSYWKIVWNRKKGKDQHEVPVTRILVKVVTEQVEYINKLWGDEWSYLFCHYQGLSSSHLNHPKMQPVKKIIPASGSPLQTAIRCLIKTLSLRDDNGELATFSPRLVRPTRLTQLFEQGHDLAVVSAWAGHKNLETTSTYYTYVSCTSIEKETLAIQTALVNAEGKALHYESLPKSFWSNRDAHQLYLTGDHINTPIYGYCGLPLDQHCDKFRACYTCHQHFVAVAEKLPLYIKTRDELRLKESRATAAGHDVLVEQFRRQADQLDKIIASFSGGDNE